MNEQNAQSLWSYDLLWSKARAYMERALNVPRDDDLFPFWSSLALELLARATLAHAHPTLVADTSEPDGRNLLHALGFEPKVKNFIPKTLRTTDILIRCQQIVVSFSKEHELFCRGFINKRNEELHSGGLPFSQLKNDSWLPRFYESCTVLLTFQSKELSDFVGLEEAQAAKKMLDAMADETAKSVQKQINAHAEVWKNKKQKEKDTLALAAGKAAQPWLGHVIDCPSCGSKALLHGEQIRQQPAVLENEELVVRSFMLPNELVCKACDLHIRGHGQIYAAGFGSQFTNTARHDPVQYYAEDPYTEEPDWGDLEEDYNNE